MTGEGESQLEALGLPRSLSRDQAHDWVAAARRLHRETVGEPSDIMNDLRESGVYFNPVASGTRLRKSLELVSKEGAASQLYRMLPSIWKLNLPENRVLLTPEGIAGSYALQEAIKHTANSTVLPRSHAAPAVSGLLTQYSKWNRHRIGGVVALLEGTDKPMQYQAIGALLLMLINDNVGAHHALVAIKEDGSRRRELIDEAFFTASHAFTLGLAPASKIRSGGRQLIGGWIIGEIKRRLGSNFVSTTEKGSEPATVYVKEEGVPAALELIVRDLARGNRKRPSATDLAEAFDRLVEIFLVQRGPLAAFGDLHESPRRTQRLRTSLLEEYRKHLHEQDPARDA